MDNESKKKHILEKFFNFSQAFILHAKIWALTHSHLGKSPASAASPLLLSPLGPSAGGKTKTILLWKRNPHTHRSTHRLIPHRKHKIRNGKLGNRTQNVSNKRKWNENSWMANKEESEIKPKKHFPSVIGGRQLPVSMDLLSPAPASTRFPISIPHSHWHSNLYPLCSCWRNFACRNAVGREMENEGRRKLKMTENPRPNRDCSREIESKEQSSRRRSVLWSCSFIYERLRWLSAVFRIQLPGVNRE